MDRYNTDIYNEIFDFFARGRDVYHREGEADVWLSRLAQQLQPDRISTVFWLHTLFCDMAWSLPQQMPPAPLADVLDWDRQLSRKTRVRLLDLMRSVRHNAHGYLYDGSGNRTIESYLAGGVRGHAAAAVHHGGWRLSHIVADWQFIHPRRVFSNHGAAQYCERTIDEILETVGEPVDCTDV